MKPLLWGKRPPPDAVKQLERLAALPDVVHVAGMPDLHVSHHVAVGTVFATRHSLIPGALGGDLGCGVSGIALDVDTESIDRTARGALLRALAAVIPVGDATQRPALRLELDDPLQGPPLSTGALDHIRKSLLGRHLGTLGGGNHFVELDRGSDGALWILVHTGSRGLGGAIADHHRRVAGDSPLASLDTRTREGEAYAHDMAWALAFARRNRQAILAHALAIVADRCSAAPVGDVIDTHHNFAAREEHGGEPLWVHRKGAIAAGEGTLAILPGSMGTASYVVMGRGEPRSLASASHGAGRVMSRTEARKRIRRDAFAHSMRDVVFDQSRATSLVEEAPAAYRDIREVLAEERDLVRTVERLTPLAVLKG